MNLKNKLLNYSLDSIKKVNDSLIHNTKIKILSTTKSNIMAKTEKTSKAVASKASKLLKGPKSSKNVKSVAASALTQASNKKNSSKKK